MGQFVGRPPGCGQSERCLLQIMIVGGFLVMRYGHVDHVTCDGGRVRTDMASRRSSMTRGSTGCFVPVSDLLLATTGELRAEPKYDVATMVGLAASELAWDEVDCGRGRVTPACSS